MLAAKQETY
jgi:hypothetical protein